MKKAIIVGDLHGCVEVVGMALAASEKEKAELIFVGDYVDSFSASKDSQVSTVVQILDLVEQGRARALIGNHEMSYLDTTKKCSGWNEYMYSMMTHLRGQIWSNFETHIWLEDSTLITHAGLTNAILEPGSTLEDIKQGLLEEKWLYQVGYSRGGNSPVGGILWSDWYRDFDTIPGLTQIFGHSRPRGGDNASIFRRKGLSTCIDVIEDCKAQNKPYTVALYVDGKVTEYKL